eukprot:TRINITY_DN368_c0_g1_i18.p2 TRINITY_DN368_c0_g1~~TRINITY_DN368_c0_g1_i18.p2  ORF type:complete len:327 (+),score=-24.52 TRINITY_DN368_c0_g1_i18:656-1636(+)
MAKDNSAFLMGYDFYKNYIKADANRRIFKILRPYTLDLNLKDLFTKFLRSANIRDDSLYFAPHSEVLTAEYLDGSDYTTDITFNTPKAGLHYESYDFMFGNKIKAKHLSKLLYKNFKTTSRSIKVLPELSPEILDSLGKSFQPLPGDSDIIDGDDSYPAEVIYKRPTKEDEDYPRLSDEFFDAIRLNMAKSGGLKRDTSPLFDLTGSEANPTKGEFFGVSLYDDELDNELICPVDSEDLDEGFVELIEDLNFNREPQGLIFGHSESVETSFYSQKGQSIQTPLRIIKYPLNFLKSAQNNDLIELIRTRFGSGSHEAHQKLNAHQTY